MPYTPEQILGDLTEIERKLAPSELNVAGHLEVIQEAPRMAVVGSRKASPQGLANAARVAETLVRLDVTVVSGLAAGIDTAAHTAALRAGGRPFAVIGTGLDRAYPRENARLQAWMAEHMAVVSQFPEGTPPRGGNFPQRNRTMALLTDATIIVEAAEKSGTISQGWEALRMGRRLFLLEPVAEDLALTWPAEMLRYGADVLRLDTLEEQLADVPLVSAAMEELLY
jgi:DNA processing protein